MGIITAFEMQAHPLRDVVHSSMVFDASDPAGLLERWGSIQENAPRELTTFLYLSPYDRTLVAQLTAVYAGEDDEKAVAALEPILDIAPLLDHDVKASRIPYASTLPFHNTPHQGSRTKPRLGSGLAVHLTDTLSAQLAEGVRSQAVRFISIRAVGGAVNDVDPQATAYPHRHQNFSIATIGMRERDFLAHWDELRPNLDGLYLNFETDRRPDRLHDAYPGETLARLRKVKAAYDPDNVFNQTFPIPPARPDL